MDAVVSRRIVAALAWIKSTVHVADWPSWLAVWHLGDLATLV